MSTLFKMWNSIQQKLFPVLEEEIGTMTEKHKALVEVVELADVGRFMGLYASKRRGRKREERLCLAVAFIAKVTIAEDIADHIAVGAFFNRQTVCRGAVPACRTSSHAVTSQHDVVAVEQFYVQLGTIVNVVAGNARPGGIADDHIARAAADDISAECN